MPFISLQDLHTKIHAGELDAIVGGDDTLVDAAIEGAIAEMRLYLFDSYDTDVIFSATGTDRHQLLVRLAVDITLYDLVGRLQAGQDTDDRRSRYDRAIKWLRAVQATQTYPNLPRREQRKQETITWGSNPRNQNDY